MLRVATFKHFRKKIKIKLQIHQKYQDRNGLAYSNPQHLSHYFIPSAFTQSQVEINFTKNNLGDFNFSGGDSRTEITPAYNRVLMIKIILLQLSLVETLLNISNAGTTNGTETIATQTAQILNYINVDDLTKTGAIVLNLNSYFNGTTDIGSFTKNPNSLLFETRSQFIDQSQFFDQTISTPKSDLI